MVGMPNPPMVYFNRIERIDWVFTPLFSNRRGSARFAFEFKQFVPVEKEFHNLQNEATSIVRDALRGIGQLRGTRKSVLLRYVQT